MADKKIGSTLLAFSFGMMIELLIIGAHNKDEAGVN